VAIQPEINAFDFDFDKILAFGKNVLDEVTGKTFAFLLLFAVATTLLFSASF